MTNDILKRLLEAMGEPDYNDSCKDGSLAVFDYLRIPVRLLNEARSAVGLPLVDEAVTP